MNMNSTIRMFFACSVVGFGIGELFNKWCACGVLICGVVLIIDAVIESP